jgi:hypothetical protein
MVFEIRIQRYPKRRDPFAWGNGQRMFELPLEETTFIFILQWGVGRIEPAEE